MSRIPCRKCTKCGLYHDLSVMTCSECGTDISAIPALLMETEEIPGEHYGDIDENAAVYVQKCSACGALNFTPDPEKRVKICYNCHRKRVASVTPTLYSTGQKQEDDTAQEHSDEKSASDDSDECRTGSRTSGKGVVRLSPADQGGNTPVSRSNDDDDDDDGDDEGPHQWSNLLGNIQ